MGAGTNPEPPPPPPALVTGEPVIEEATPAPPARPAFGSEFGIGWAGDDVPAAPAPPPAPASLFYQILN